MSFADGRGIHGCIVGRNAIEDQVLDAEFVARIRYHFLVCWCGPEMDLLNMVSRSFPFLHQEREWRVQRPGPGTRRTAATGAPTSPRPCWFSLAVNSYPRGNVRLRRHSLTLPLGDLSRFNQHLFIRFGLIGFFPLLVLCAGLHVYHDVLVVEQQQNRLQRRVRRYIVGLWACHCV
ncbi:hypothetical protein F4818DRAFT_282221 [Hypoxylon cercidicola]|nr:hypothetical protein F4818DRAFT_282221 [Hypoxylon cercidicola]